MTQTEGRSPSGVAAPALGALLYAEHLRLGDYTDSQSRRMLCCECILMCTHDR